MSKQPIEDVRPITCLLVLALTLFWIAVLWSVILMVLRWLT